MGGDRIKLAYVVNVDWYFKLHWVERAEYFLNKGFSIYIIGEFTDDINRKFLESKGFNCVQCSLERKSLNLINEIRTIYTFWRILKEISPDLIHTITVKPNLYVGLINSFIVKRPIVYAITGLGATFTSRLFKFKIIRKFVTFIYKIISNSRSRFIFENGEDLQKFHELGILNYNGVLVRGAGIDLKKFSPRKDNDIKSKTTVLFAARLLKDKGLEYLIEAKEILAKEGILFDLNVAGIIDTDVSDAISVNDILLLEREGKIIWHGNVKNMPSLLNNNDIVCLPTIYGEGVPRILIEAAACAKAIVTTDVPGCRELIRNEINGLLSIPGSSSSLAQCLRVLIQDKSLALAYGVEARRVVEKEFSDEIVFKKTEDVYKTLLFEND